MKAIILNKNGGPEVLTIHEITEPETTNGAVKIKIKAFGLNKLESYVRQGIIEATAIPAVLGIEAVGEVVEDKSGRFEIGQKVITVMGGLGMTRQGSYAEYVVSPVENVLAINSNISYEELAAIPESFGTIAIALDKVLKIRAGEILLIKGGTSAAGAAAILYAKLKGLKVIATTRNVNKFLRLKELGADYMIIDNGNVSEEVRKIVPDGVHKALDVVGGDKGILDTVAAVRPFGEVTVIGLLGGPPIIPDLNLMTQLGQSVKISFSQSGLLGNPAYPLQESPLSLIAEHIASGKMISIRTATFRFDEIADAHKLMDSNKTNGKIVIIV
ncbi:alcohol dehydrogenase [Pedobacter lusitanus]|uniref:Alcohol dehydrogenase n=1 Tax=Pedobacter lusitanus TaxID=1503925 RepID=A0A0D0GNZ9_9SPHI|nr:zinc-binding dehydrogenase [Pedobacter lusitanus]KIO78992.1 alcohol dehydrogenase [Pedobacter lusitanus]